MNNLKRKKTRLRGLSLALLSGIIMGATVPTLASAATTNNISTVTDFDNGVHVSDSSNTKANEMFGTSGSATSGMNGSQYVANLTSQSGKKETGAMAFNKQIDFSKDFAMSGQIGFSSTGGDGISMIFSPVNPNKIASGVSGAGLGLWGLPNSFGLVFDMYANDGTTNILGIHNYNMGDFNNDKATNASKSINATFSGSYTDGMSGVPGNGKDVKANSGGGVTGGSSVGATEQVINWRYTDNAGKLIAVDGANKNTVLGSNPGNQVASVNASLTSGYEDMNLSYNASSGLLTVSIPNNAKTAPILGLLNQTYGSNTDAKTWTIQIPDTYKTQGYSMGVVATDSDQSANNFGFKLNSYSMPTKTANVTVNGQADPATSDSSDFVYGQTKAVANVGDAITVIRDDTQLAAAKAMPGFDPNYVYLAPQVNGYVFDQPQQLIVDQDDSKNQFTLNYKKKAKLTVHYQIKGQTGYIDDTVGGAGSVNGVEGDSYNIPTPTLAGYTPDIASVTGKLSGNTTEVVTYTPLVISPLNPLAPDVAQPVQPLDGVSGDQVGNGTGGALSIDFAPSFNFGTQAIKAGKQTYYASAQQYTKGTTATTPYLQVTDHRLKQPGWKVNATLSNFKSSTGEILPVSSLKYSTDAVNVAQDSTLATQNQVGSGLGSSFTSNTLLPTVTTTVLAAKSGEGLGTFIASFGKADDLDSGQYDADGVAKRTVAKSVALNVIDGQNAKATAYDASITWTLLDTPSN
ncbi:hypothetical protein EQG49_00510 [Periweissella cryptocerci]|uniref:WxL domain-containing protein n=1 Tax=Periweissella cryptocerci TaxID=2506420 RepID=A0A4P6YR12_9LACO|nr:WxL domain-containing protein [Periweissella cryptocerci]QBO35036.1 hypothetical protein EQG49_00510 [Periweissella cryptocerci]